MANKKRRSPRRPPTRQGDAYAETHERILDAIIRLSFKIGIEQLTLQKVAREAKLSYFGVHYHFGDQDLGRAAIASVGQAAQRYIGARIEQAALEGDQSLLDVYVAGTLAWARENQAHASLWTYYYLCSIKSEMREANLVFIDTARKRVERLVTEEIGAGRLPRLTQVPELAAKIHSTLIGGTLAAATEARPSAYSDSEKRTIDTIAALIAQHRPG